VQSNEGVRPSTLTHRRQTRRCGMSDMSGVNVEGLTPTANRGWTREHPGLGETRVERRRRSYVELGGIEPPSAMGEPFKLRPFPRLWLAVATLPGQVGHEGHTAGSFSDVSGLSRRQRSFPAVHQCFCCRAALVRPREPLLVPMTLYYLEKTRRRERHARCRVFGCPVLGV